jgi:hypothetical protein
MKTWTHSSLDSTNLVGSFV